MKRTIGIFAHVDAGKTTFSEQLLFNNGAMRQRGRVDDKNTVLDTDDIEKERGITVFSGTSYFEYSDDTYYIIDTPGHSDFFPEARRTMPVIDAAVLLISASDLVQAHTELIWNRLKAYNIPTMIFLNKSDLAHLSIDDMTGEIARRLSEDICLFGSLEFYEKLAETDEKYMEKYLSSENTGEDTKRALASAFGQRKIFPLVYGSALKNEGMDEFNALLGMAMSYTENIDKGKSLAKVYKIVNDKNGNRIAFLRIISGILKPKDKIDFDGFTETVNEIRFYKGSRYELRPFAKAGDVCAVTGLRTARAGDIIGDEYIPSAEDDVSVLLSRLYANDGTNISALLAAAKVFEDEEPSLKVLYNNDTSEIQISTTGKIQLEILKAQFKSRFGIDVAFGKCEVHYKETIGKAVRGYGHFEPLKHYAEVHLELIPKERNSGLGFSSVCHTDKLPKDKQNLIEQYALGYEHRGILTCSLLTDVEIVLIAGAVHEKHTHGGDLMEATCRAVRQGLEYAENILLEPWYDFSISVPNDYVGRLMTELTARSADYTPPQTFVDIVTVKGRIPVGEAYEYFDELILYTKGRAQISASFGGYDVCHNSDEVIRRISYDKDSDRNHSSDSIFCSHGSGYPVPWYEAKEHMHIK